MNHGLFIDSHCCSEFLSTAGRSPKLFRQKHSISVRRMGKYKSRSGLSPAPYHPPSPFPIPYNCTDPARETLDETSREGMDYDRKQLQTGDVCPAMILILEGG
ncbi:hypothetical protein FRB95_004284 [Tulasnella sp. JGI-2019a]|nr:hypothetical protein FRB95_004284 [Tulasnella sp. JGI-2019a]